MRENGGSPNGVDQRPSNGLAAAVARRGAFALALALALL
jgi:hypothetical protein